MSEYTTVSPINTPETPMSWPRTAFRLPVVLLVFGAATARAQTDGASRFLDHCKRYGGDREQFCETRDLSLPASRSLTVDGGENGGVAVQAWDRNEIKVTVLIQAWAESVGEAERLAKQVTVTTSAGHVRATGPSRRDRNESWSVSYEIWTPRHIDLSLTASNGGISVDDVDGRLDLETVNGGVHLRRVAGDVRGRTANGGVTAELSGSSWSGAGLDLQTTNGGVRLALPRDYSAQLELGTVNGSLDIGFPITVHGSLKRRVTTTLGHGGPTIRAVTTNGGVQISER